MLAAGLLLGVIALLWGSLRILSGDAALSPELEALDMAAQGVDALASRKKMLLRALKDLETERSLGKLEDEDFEQISALTERTSRRCSGGSTSRSPRTARRPRMPPGSISRRSGSSRRTLAVTFRARAMRRGDARNAKPASTTKRSAESEAERVSVPSAASRTSATRSSARSARRSSPLSRRRRSPKRHTSGDVETEESDDDAIERDALFEASR